MDTNHGMIADALDFFFLAHSRVNLPRHSGPLPFMMQQAQLMQPPPQLQQTVAMDATRKKYRSILVDLVNRGGDPSLRKKLEELDAGGPRPDMSEISGLSPEKRITGTEGPVEKRMKDFGGIMGPTTPHY